MDLTRRRVLVVPDPQAWAMAGVDLRAKGFDAVGAPERAEGLLVPDVVPAALLAPVEELGARVPVRPGVVLITGEPAPPERRKSIAHAAAGDHAEHHDMGDMGDMSEMDDMMAIVGEPSTDGLVMEVMQVRLGPLGSPLPGGLLVDLELDGDVVADATVRATLAGPGRPERRDLPDALSPLSWRAALDGARGDAADLAAVEVERALSHSSWLSSFAFVLGHRRLAAQADDAVRVLLAVRRIITGEGTRDLDPDLEAAQAPVGRLAHTCREDRGLRSRLHGLAVLEAAVLEQRRIGGPVARAVGSPRDARIGDPAYDAIGFRPVLATDGDALARLQVRAQEAVDALAHARALAGAAPPARGLAGRLSRVEGPRGQLHAIAGAGGMVVVAPGARALLDLAGAAMRGLEVGSAITALASFDLSPWRVGP